MTTPPESIAGGTSNVRKDFLSSIVVFLVALPLCMGISIASGTPVATGLITGIVGGIVVGLLSGAPLQVSGPAAGLTVIVYDIVQRLGLEMLGLVVLVAGVMQIVAGAFRLGQWFRAVSPAVIKGMLAGIGVLIFASQFHVMVDDAPKGSGIENLLSIPQAISKGMNLPKIHDRDVRQFRANTLREVGELHRRQVRLEERLAEHAELLAAPSDRGSDTSDGLGPYATEQQALTAELAAITERVGDFERELNDGERSEAVRVAAASALAKGKTAEETLHEGAELEAVISSQRAAENALNELVAQLKNHGMAAEIGILTILVIIGWQAFAPASLKMIPAPLVAIVLATAAASVLVLPVIYVEVPDQLWDEIHVPTASILHSAPWKEVLGMAVMIAVVASAETLLCTTALDQMHTGPRAKYDKELFAQGVGNMVCGFVGALPMTGVIVRSSANVQSGGQTRLSTILHGIWLLLFVVGLSFVLRMIPTSSLAAMLVYTGYKLVDIKSIRKLREYGWGEVAIYAATVSTIVATDLLTGVLTGIALAAVKLLYTFSHLKVRLNVDEDSRKAVLSLEGAATFIRLPRLATKLEDVPPGSELHVDFERLDYIDHACLDLLMNWAQQHETTGGQMVIDWDRMHANFRREGRSKGRTGDAASEAAKTE